MNDLRIGFDWRASLRAYRQSRRMSQAEVARRAGLSPSAVKGYEGGQRHPSSEALAAIIDALGMPFEQANPIRAGAGYAIDWRAILNERYTPDPDGLQAEVDHYRWPVFVTNQASDVLRANKALRSVLDLDSRRDFAREPLNILGSASDPAFASRVENWDEAMTFMLGLAKAERRYEHNLERPAAPVQAAMAQFLHGSPEYIARILRLWEDAPAIPHRIRFHYNFHWRMPSGAVARFVCSMTVADIWDELSWHDWVPADEDSWRAISGR